MSAPFTPLLGCLASKLLLSRSRRLRRAIAGRPEMLLRALCLAAAFSVAVAASAQATSCATPCLADASSGEHIYGYIMNTDAGTFDGVALSKAVRATAETAYLAVDPTMRSIRMKRTNW